MKIKTRSHFIISGVGRSGTTFIVTLLTHLGLDTGFNASDIEDNIDKNSKGGLEFNILKSTCPYIVKSPWFCHHAETAIKNEEIDIDHVLIPIRELYSSAESRRQAAEKGSIKGGLWDTTSFERGAQEAVLAEYMYGLIYTLTRYNIPFSFVEFPNLINDPKYLYDELHMLVKNIPFKKFLIAFNKTRHPHWIHDYE